MQTLECVLWHSGLKCEVVFDQGGLSRGGLLYFEQHPYNTQWYICSTPEGVLEVHEMFYYSGRV